MFPEKHFKHIVSSLQVQGLFKWEVPRVLELEVLRNHLYHFHSVEKWASSLPLTHWAKESVSWGFTGLNRQRPACLLLMSLLHIPPANIWWRVLGMLPCSHLNLRVQAASVCSISISFDLVPNAPLFLWRGENECLVLCLPSQISQTLCMRY